MHELSIVQLIVDAVTESAPKTGTLRVPKGIVAVLL